MSAEANHGARPTTKNPTRAILLGILLVAVLAAGIGVGLALGGRDGKSSGTSTQNNTPPAGTVPGSANPSVTPGQPTTATGAPTTPAPQGSALGTVTAPPQGTLAMIDATKLKSDAEYEIVFSPYGYGPPQGGNTLVIRITGVEANTDSAAAFDISDRNMLVLLGPGETAPASGGSYSARLTFRTQGDLLLPVIGDLEPAK